MNLNDFLSVFVGWVNSAYGLAKSVFDSVFGNGTYLTLITLTAFVGSLWIFLIRPLYGGGSSDKAKRKDNDE